MAAADVIWAIISLAEEELEEELGFQLFIRTPNGVMPTHQGQEFLRRAQRLNDEHRHYGK